MSSSNSEPNTIETAGSFRANSYIENMRNSQFKSGIQIMTLMTFNNDWGIIFQFF